MQERIAKLEAQNMADKDWFMQGEAGAGEKCCTDKTQICRSCFALLPL